MPRLLRYAAAALVLALVGALAVPAFYGDAIGERALAAARAQLRTDLAAGGVSLSLLREFPYASVALEDVRLGGFPENQLLVAGSVSGRVSYYDLLFADGWVVNTVTVRDATLEVVRPADGRPGNWAILRPDTTGAATAGVGFAIERILLEGVDVRYRDGVNAADVDVRVEAGELRGDFSADAYVLRGELEGRSRHVGIGASRYLPDCAVAVDLELDVDPSAGTYVFGPTTVTTEGMPVRIAGSIGAVAGSTAYRLRLATEQGELGALLRSLPADWLSPGVRAMRSRGAFALEGTVEGLSDARRSPAVAFAGELRGGSLYLPALDRTVGELAFALEYDNGEAHSLADSRLALRGVRGELDGQPFNGSVRLRNLLDPHYDLAVNGTLPLAWLDALWPEAELTGRLELRDVALRGRHRELTDPRYADRLVLDGGLRLHRAGLRYAGEDFAVDAPALALDGGALELAGLTVRGLGDELRLDLTLDHLVPFVLGGPDAVLDVRGELAAEHVALDRWVGLFAEGHRPGELTPKGEPADPARRAGGSGAALTADAPLVMGFAGRLTLRADAVDYADVRVRRFEGTCSLDGVDLELTGEGFAMEGHWAIDGGIALTQRPRLYAKLACSEVNITELFEQTGDVGQDVVQARHLAGQMTARTYVEAAWDRDWTLDYDGLHVWANVGLTDGELADFEMLQALSAYVRSEELAHIRFTDVENWVEVTGKRVYLPAMFIQSTATNFTVAGEHSFAHDIDYGVRVNGAQVLLTKLFGKRPGLDYLPDRRSGWVRTGFKIDGSLVDDAYEVRMAGPEVRRQFRSSQRRKDAIRRKLTPLFGAESLIDDYDAEGERRTDRPATRSRAVASAGPVAQPRERLPAERSREFGAPEPADAPDRIDADTYLDWEEEGPWDEDPEPASRPESASDPESASRPERVAAELPASGRARGAAFPSRAAEPADRVPAERQPDRRGVLARRGLLDGLFAPSGEQRRAPAADADDDGFLEGFDEPGGGG